MEKRIFKKILVILTIIMILATDFFVLGSNLISYAASLDSSTNNENIEFSAYFKGEGGNKVSNINTSIKSSNLKMYAEIAVRNEGYFNGTIELKEGNFNIKNNVMSNYIESIEGNKIKLKQINAGSTVEIELDIEPIITETISVDMLSMNSTIKLTGEYTQTKQGILDTDIAKTTIEATKTVKANFGVDETAEAELVTDIITNTKFAVNGTNKRVVQLLIKSRLTENQYPVNQTTIEVEIPNLSGKQPEDVKVLALGTQATNGKSDSTIENFSNQNGKIKITLKNDANLENNISWNKNVYDELVVTLTYAEDVDVSKVEIKTNSEIKLYNSTNTYTATYTKGIENQTLNKTITTQIEPELLDIYKGQLYANTKLDPDLTEGIGYNTKTILQVTNPDLADTIVIKEGKDVFVTSDSTELQANTVFVETEINKEKMLEILGQDGTIQINDGTVIQNISKDTEVNESGNIVINHETALDEIQIILSKPVKAGILEINHVKVITENTYTIEQLKLVNKLKLQNSVTGTVGENVVVENITESSFELKETETKAELTINKNNLSTIATNTEVIIGVKLITNDTKYDLYKNPKITIQLPSFVEEVEVNGAANKLYADEFDLTATYNKETKLIEITLVGEQTTYPESEAAQAYLQFNLNLKLSKLEPNKTDKIVMTYTNENATQYAGGTTDVGIVEKTIGIISPSGLIPVNNIETYGIEGIGGVSESKQIVNINKNTAVGTDVKYNIALVNNTKNDVNNVRILGVLPTEGTFVVGEETITNTLLTTLKSVTATNGTIYYSNNINATADLSDANNGWNPNLAEVTNPKTYLIVVANLQVGQRFDATYTVTLPTTLDYGLTSYAGYQVLFNEGTDTTNQKIQSTLAGITTGEGIKLETSISATVGNDTLKDGDIVKTGEVITYTVTVKNNGTQTLEEIFVRSGVPTGTVVVEPKEGYEYSGLSYYEEKTEVVEMLEMIPSLSKGESYTFSYEVRVNMNVTMGTEISNKAISEYNEFEIHSNEFKNKVETSKVRLTLKSIYAADKQRIAGENETYIVCVENLSNESIKNLNVKVSLSGQTIVEIHKLDFEAQVNGDTVTITEIKPGQIGGFEVFTLISGDTSEMKAGVVATETNGAMSRSNIDKKQVDKENAQITLTTPNNGAYVNIGDEIVYDIVVENTSNVFTHAGIKDEISENLVIEKITINGDVKMQNLDHEDEKTYVNSIANKFNYNISLNVGQQIVLSIVARVKHIEEKFELKTIKNSAQLIIDGKVRQATEEVTHIIKGQAEEKDDGIQKIVSGLAWFDENQNGQKESDEKLLSGIKVRLFDISTNNIAKDKDNNIVETTTNSDGEYIFTRIPEGKYIVLFEFDTTQYELTTYMKDDVQESQNSNVVLKAIEIDGQEKIYAVTDTIQLSENISNINMGLKEKLSFDLELNKYISRIVVQNNKETKSYEYKESNFQKIEIHSKQINDSFVVLEYTIRVKNTGEIAGNVNSIVDYLPSGLEFSSELNPNWYLSGGNLYTNSLNNDKIQPGESRNVKLILTKKMTENNVGLVNNRAEIEEYFNEFGQVDIDSKVNNLSKNEDDIGAADVIISISTGATTIAYIILIIINMALISVAIYLIFKRSKIRK